MGLTNLPFYKFGQEDIPRPWLPLIIKNPKTSQAIKVYGLIDTGADECALPAGYASLLGLTLQEGQVKDINTGNGLTKAYAHVVSLEIKDYRFNNVLIDFMPNLHVPLLGVKSFLSRFILTIDYPKRKFSLT